MSQQTIDYPKLVEHALRHVVRDTLTLIAVNGLPGRHNIYITFRTDHRGVSLSEELKGRYPTEMTIVLQHEFWDLEVRDDGFGVTLSFNNVPQRIEIPFSAISVFADPSVEFGLQFNLSSSDDDIEEDDGASDALDKPEGEVATMPRASGADHGKDKSVEADKDGDGAEVVTLDQFRKKS